MKISEKNKQIFFGCPKCGELKHFGSKKVFKTNKRGNIIHDRLGNEKFEYKHEYTEGNELEWKRLILTCVKCGNKYDKREALTKEYGCFL